MERQGKQIGAIGLAEAVLFCAVVSITCPVFAGNYGGGSGTMEDPYQIWTAEQWQIFMNEDPENIFDKHFILMADLYLGGMEIRPICPDQNSISSGYQGTAFQGVFDGNGHVIRNAVINRPGEDFIGLFGFLGKNGLIQNLLVDNVFITGKDNVGGLMGWNEGRITSCHVTGSVHGIFRVGGLVGQNGWWPNGGTITSCITAVMVDGNQRIGGLAGDNYKGTITSCFANGLTIGNHLVGGLVGVNERSSTINSCSATGNTNGDSIVGGLAGSNWLQSKITLCYAEGDVSGQVDIGGLVGISGSTITYCFATGTVTGTSDVGGLTGTTNDGTITSCYATGAVYGDSGVGGLVGHSFVCEDCSLMISSCYATGKLTGTSQVGGLCGSFFGWGSAIAVGNFWDIQTSEITTSAFGVGKTTAEMKTKATFAAAGWDFGVWQMCEESDPNDPQAYYPRLRWQVPKVDWVCPDGVAMEDFLYLAERWLATTPATMGQADTNGDGKVDIEDLAILSENWMR